MAEIVKGLFGIDPQGYQEDRLAQQNAEAIQYAKLDPFQKATVGIYQGVQQGIGAGLNMMGVEDPELKAQQIAAQLAAQYDKTTAEGMAEFSKALGQKAEETGLPALSGFANMAGQKALSMKGTQLSNTQTEMNITKTKHANDREEKLREALAALPEDATDQDYLKVYRQWGSPDQMARIIESGITARAKNAPKELTEDQQKLKEYEDQLMVSTVDDALKLTSNWSAGYGSVLAFMPQSDARKLQGRLDTVKSDLAAAMISDMKSQSKTGATGLGALNREELKVLQTARASLDAGMGAEELTKSLKIIDKYFRIRSGMPLTGAPNDATEQPGTKPTSGASSPKVIKLD